MGKGVLPFSLRARLSRPRAADAAEKIAAGAKLATLSISSLIVPGEKTSEGLLVTSTSAVWHEIVRLLGDDWSSASNIPPEKWEELVAGAYQKAGYDEVTLTPRSSDHGRDVIAIKKGVGSVKVIGSVKAYHPSHKVEYDAVRALMGVVAADPSASKGIITTTSDFPTKIADDPFIASQMPTRLELMNGAQLQAWLRSLEKE